MQDTDILSEVVISDKIKQLERIDVNRILDEVLREIEEFILDLNREQLYEKGEIDVNVPGYKESYAESTKKQKVRSATFKKTDFITLRWDGEFYDSFKLLIFEKEFIISATDLKWSNFLEKSHGLRFSNALGLTPESRDKLKKEILPLMIKKLRDEL